MSYKTYKIVFFASIIAIASSSFPSFAAETPLADSKAGLIAGPANPNVQNAGESEEAYKAMIRNTEIKIASMEKALEEGMKTKKAEIADKTKEVELLNKMQKSLKDPKTKKDYDKKLTTAMAEEKSLQSAYDNYIAMEQQKIALSKEVNESVKAKHSAK
ncbi:MAG: hypothetical protein Q8K37_07625 [Alphaproteobacteria bacterium]|nr:hypothetical protein [Alphaproteobacteria bacterium]